MSATLPRLDEGTVLRLRTCEWSVERGQVGRTDWDLRLVMLAPLLDRGGWLRTYCHEMACADGSSCRLHWCRQVHVRVKVLAEIADGGRP